MPRLAKTLTPTAIKNAKPENKRYTLFDGAVSGLHVLILPNGTKSFRLKANVSGKDKRITLGSWPDTTLEEAREIARSHKSKIKQGIDPTAPVTGNTFESVFKLWLKKKESLPTKNGTKLKDSTKNGFQKCFDNNLKDPLGARNIKEIHTADVVPILEKINLRSNSLAIKTNELVNMVIRYAIQRNHRNSYTALDLKGVITRKQPKLKTIPEDIPGTFKRIDDYPYSIMRYAMQLQFHFFLRSAEIMSLEWNDVDFKKREILIPAKRMKMPRAHIVPLSNYAIKLLRELRKTTGTTKHLFPSAHNDSHLCRDALSKAFRLLDLGLTPHQCRTVASTWFSNNDFNDDHTEIQLSHAIKGQIKAAYKDKPHMLYLKERHPMMQAWSKHLCGNP